MAVSLAPLPANVPLAPLAGAVKVTDAPEITFPNPSVRTAAKAVAYDVPTLTVWPPPAVAVRPAAPAGVMAYVPDATESWDVLTLTEYEGLATVGFTAGATTVTAPAATGAGTERVTVSDTGPTGEVLVPFTE